MVMGNNKTATTKIAVESQAISIAIRMRRYNAGRIAQYSTSRASLWATGCRHRASACTLLPRWTPWLGQYSPRIVPEDAMVIDFGVKNQVVALWNRILKLALKRHETDPLLSS